MGENVTDILDAKDLYTHEQSTKGYRSPFDTPGSTHITIGVIVAVVIVVAILVAIWCFRPCATRDRKTASTATSIASI